jgi:hypothetical protein
VSSAASAVSESTGGASVGGRGVPSAVTGTALRTDGAVGGAEAGDDVEETDETGASKGAPSAPRDPGVDGSGRLATGTVACEK